MGSGEDTEQKEDQRERQIPSMVEGIHGGGKHLGESREPEKCRGCVKGVRGTVQERP